MTERRDAVGGVALAAAGLVFAGYAARQYDLGDLRQMGPGLFPVGLGLTLAALGALAALAPLVRRGAKPAESPPVFRWRPAVMILSGIVGFALLVRPFGLIPAVLCVVALSSTAEGKLRAGPLAILCAALCLIAYLVFNLGLRLPLPLARWPL